MTTSKWRQRFKVHPAADPFPMMSAKELAKLGADIKEHGLKDPITFNTEDVLLDGRNRLEAGERAGVPVCDQHHLRTFEGDDAAQVAFIISKNIHRRHLNKTQRGTLIVAAIKAGKQVSRHGGKPKKGGRPKSTIKAAAIATGKKHDIGKRRIERAIAEDEGKAKTNRPEGAKPDSEKLDAARQRYLKQCEGPEVDLDKEREIVIDALRKIASERPRIMIITKKENGHA